MPPLYQIEFLKGRNYFCYKLPKLDTTLYCQMAIKLPTQLVCVLGPATGLLGCKAAWGFGQQAQLLFCLSRRLKTKLQAWHSEGNKS